MAATAASLRTKSPAEFFSENQNIAGFDNAGKSLYTTIREFVENSLDASEAIGVLPEIELTVEALPTDVFNKLRGVTAHTRIDLELYQGNAKKAKKQKGADGKAIDEDLHSDEDEEGEKKGRGAGASTGFFRIRCRDNGAGMPHEKIPNMLGVVLSSTKYGVKQSRGKYGLGAKMALVWSKKSTGLPIEVRSATSTTQPVTYCKLDIDIYKNQPRVLAHDKLPNTEQMRGTEITVVIAGNWSSYKAKIINYLRQLAIITPYAQFMFRYTSPSDKSFAIKFARRTDQMPPPPKETKHHPSAINNLLVEQLIHHCSHTTTKAFLTKELTGISGTLASRLISELGDRNVTDLTDPHNMSKESIYRLAALLQAAQFDPPDASCLSPAGEYNLRLGIIKEVRPELVATFSAEPRVFEGHAFIVEAGIALGGKGVSPGIHVHRFANRIPLLFESGSDIVTQIAMKEIKWGAYKIKVCQAAFYLFFHGFSFFICYQSTDAVGVYVSLVSTKIPFKGTSKEYIGDDKGDMHEAIKQAITHCCVQLRSKIVRLAAHRERADRKKSITKYIPDVCRAVFGVMSTISAPDASFAFGPRAPQPAPASEQRRGVQLLEQFRTGLTNQASLEVALERHVDQADMEAALEEAVQTTAVADKERVHVACFPRAPSFGDAASVAYRAVSVRYLAPLIHGSTGARLQFFQPMSLPASLFPSV
jgi:DNA topoisomerase VI B subunit